MNIALFSDSYLPTKNGVVTVVIQLRKILQDMGHHVVVVTVSERGLRHSNTEDPNILRIRAIPSPVGDDLYLAIPTREKIIEFCKSHKVELIHSHTEFFMGHAAKVVGRKLKIPVIASTHTMWEDYYRYYFPLGRFIPHKIIRKTEKNLLRKFYAFVNVSKKANDYFNRPYMHPKTPSAIIPNAIDAQKFSGQEFSDREKKQLRKSLGIGKNDRVLLYVGRVVEEKRLVELLEVIIRVLYARQNVKMVFVGAGGALDILQKNVADEGLGDKIIFTGFVDWNKVYQYYSIGDVFITASLSEMHSMTILEALSLGLPCVCRRDTSFYDTIFPGEDGYFAESDEDMDDLILKLVDDPELCERMGKKAVEVSRRFTLELHGKRTVAFYQKVLDTFPKKLTSKELQKAVDSVTLN